jgi:hypothetical protein
MKNIIMALATVALTTSIKAETKTLEGQYLEYQGYLYYCPTPQDEDSMCNPIYKIPNAASEVGLAIATGASIGAASALVSGLINAIFYY